MAKSIILESAIDPHHGERRDIFLYKGQVDGAPAVIKIFRAQQDYLPFKSRFEREKLVLQAMQGSPYFCQLLGAGYATEGEIQHGPEIPALNTFGWYLIQERFEAESLHNLIAQEGLRWKARPLAKRASLLLEVIRGVAELHDSSWIHRDIKVGNVLAREISGEWQVKIIDFETAKIVGEARAEEDLTRRMITTQRTASPEHANPEIDLTIASDIFSIGVEAVRILTGESAMSTHHSDKKAVASELALLAKHGLPKEWIDIIAPCLNLDPAKRYGSLAELIARVENCLEQESHFRLGFAFGDKLQTRKELAEMIRVAKDELNGTVTVVARSGSSLHLYGESNIYECALDPRRPDEVLVVGSVQKLIPEYESRRLRQGIKCRLSSELHLREGDVPKGVYSTADFINHLRSVRERQEKRKIYLRNQRQKVKWWLRLADLSIKSLQGAAAISAFKDARLSGDLVEMTLIQPEGFSVGCELRLEGTTSSQRLGRLVRISKDRATIQISNPIKAVQAEGKIKIDQHFELLPWRQIKRVLTRLQNGNVNALLSRLLWEPEAVPAASNIAACEIEGLNPAQRETAGLVLSGAPITVVHGPPGTGKTRMIARIVCEFLRQRPTGRVLISSQTNVALDHALLAIRKALKTAKVKGARIVRTGAVTSLSEELNDLAVEKQESVWRTDVSERVGKWLASQATSKELDDSTDLLAAQQEASRLARELTEIEGLVVTQQGTVTAYRSELEAVAVPQPVFSALTTWLERQPWINQSLESESFSGADENRLQDELRQEANNSVGDNPLDETHHEGLMVWFLALVRLKHALGIREKLRMALSKIGPVDGASAPDEITKKRAKAIAAGKDWKRHLDDAAMSLREDFIQFAAPIVGATCYHAARFEEDRTTDFDLVIVDEAGRANPGELIAPLMCGKQLLLIGDFKQLPPFTDGSIRKEVEDLAKSMKIPKADHVDYSLFHEIFDRINRGCRRQLNEQYRMPSVVCEMISEIFYDGQLVHRGSHEKKTLLLSKQPLIWLDTSREPHRYEKRLGTSFVNEHEAALIRRLIAQHPTSSQIAVLTGYAGQAEMLRRHLSGVGRPIEIETVDSYQGREAEIVIYSCVRSNPQFKIGFLADVRRLNVALSRAQDQLVIVGDSENLTIGADVADATTRENRFPAILAFIKGRQSAGPDSPAIIMAAEQCK